MGLPTSQKTINFADMFRKEVKDIVSLYTDEKQEEAELKEVDQGGGSQGAGETLMDIVAKVDDIKKKHTKKRKEIIAHSGDLVTDSKEEDKGDKLREISVDLNENPVTLFNDPPKKTIKTPKKVLNVKREKPIVKEPKSKIGKSRYSEQVVPRVDKSTNSSTANSKNYNTVGGDVTASSEIPEAPGTSLALGLLFVTAVGLGIYFYLRK